MFYHSLISDWNHGNAHFLRGMVSELISRGHEVRVYEPSDGWSLKNLRAAHGNDPLIRFQGVYNLKSNFYDFETLDLDVVLDGADLVIVHEWNDHGLVKRIGEHRASTRSYRLLFHDTHHRCVTEPGDMAAYDLTHYDGVLAYGRVIRDIYLERSWTQRAWTWHEAADISIFRPHHSSECAKERQLVWIGNWGDEERTSELMKFFVEPVMDLKLDAQAYGVRYPGRAIAELARAGIAYGGWLPNFEVPRIFARFAATVHIPRRPYVEALPGIPTIRPFEALACGIPLVCSPWNDAEGLFTPGKDYLVAYDGRQMRRHLQAILNDKGLAEELSSHGLSTILARHTCAHRSDELFSIYRQLESGRNSAGSGSSVRYQEVPRNVPGA